MKIKINRYLSQQLVRNRKYLIPDAWEVKLSISFICPCEYPSWYSSNPTGRQRILYFERYHGLLKTVHIFSLSIMLGFVPKHKSIQINCLKYTNILFLNRPNPASFCLYFRSFHSAKTNVTHILTIIQKSIDGLHWTRTRGGRMLGADESHELWRHPYTNFFY